MMANLHIHDLPFTAWSAQNDANVLWTFVNVCTFPFPSGSSSTIKPRDFWHHLYHEMPCCHFYVNNPMYMGSVVLIGETPALTTPLLCANYRRSSHGLIYLQNLIITIN